MLLTMLFAELTLVAADFEEYDIRVIRPRYFAKKKRLELGTEAIVVMNQTFIYTYLLSGILTYHFNESMALELSGAYGFSVDKDDKRVLKEDFAIRTAILRAQYMALGTLVYTPIYGKYQVQGGSVIYFDTFISVSGGMTGVEYLYDHCSSIDEQKASNPTGNAEQPPAEQTKSYPTFALGLGQKFYLNKKDSIRWDVRNHLFSYDLKDGSCFANAESSTDVHNNITLQMGWSRFF